MTDSPRYKHHCDNCQLIDQYLDYDIYFANEDCVKNHLSGDYRCGAIVVRNYLGKEYAFYTTFLLRIMANNILLGIHGNNYESHAEYVGLRIAILKRLIELNADTVHEIK